MTQAIAKRYAVQANAITIFCRITKTCHEIRNFLDMVFNTICKIRTRHFIKRILNLCLCDSSKLYLTLTFTKTSLAVC